MVLVRGNVEQDIEILLLVVFELRVQVVCSHLISATLAGEQLAAVVVAETHVVSYLYVSLAGADEGGEKSYEERRLSA